MPSSFRVALVGTGRVGYQFSFSDVPDNHAEAIVANPRTDLVAGVNRSREKLDAFGERFGIAALFHDMGLIGMVIAIAGVVMVVKSASK